MAIIVQKFGGTSVADAPHIHLAARRAVRAKLAGKQVVLVASAMGRTTNQLIDLARRITRRPAKRELDALLSTGEQISIALMAMAIHEAGHEALSLTGAQVGLMTDSRFSSARIRSINAERIRTHLDRNTIVIVAGFQGVDPEFNITTLGRGGSDTTAVALAAALRAETCEIYTDVDGVFTADPRLVPQARRIARLSYDEMLELARLGAGVVHSRAIELGMKHSVPIHVRSSFVDTPGTLIMTDTAGMEEGAVRGVTLKRDVARLSLTGAGEDGRATPAALFAALAKRHVSIDDILQHRDATGALTLVLTVEADELGAARSVAEQFAAEHGFSPPTVTESLARVSAVGVGMRTQSDVAARMFGALAAAGIVVENVATSEIVISAIVAAGDADRAVQAVHGAFGLGG